MKSKLNYLIGISLNRKIKTKWFMIANIILAIVITGIINIDSIITFFGGDFNDTRNLYVIDETNMAIPLLEEHLKANSSSLVEEGKEYFHVVKSEESFEELKKKVEEDDKNILVVIKENPETVLEVSVVSNSFMDSIDFQILSTALNNTKVSIAMANSNIPIEEINKIYSALDIKREILDENKKSEDEGMSMIMTTVFPVVILPFFMLSLFLVQMIGAEVNDEKTTRGMEIIISNVSPKTHFFAKVIAGNLFVLIQGSLLVVFAVFGFLIRHLIGGSSITNGLGGEVSNVLSQLLSSGFGEKLIYIIPITLLLMVLTFIAYSLLAGILASMTTNIEDFQQVQTPIMIISLVGYYLAMMAGMFKGALFIKILSFVPFISAILSPSLLVLGQIGIIEILISCLIMVGAIYLLIKYGLRIYKVGILNYSAKGLWKKMLKALKN